MCKCENGILVITDPDVRVLNCPDCEAGRERADAWKMTPRTFAHFFDVTQGSDYETLFLHPAFDEDGWPADTVVQERSSL